MSIQVTLLLLNVEDLDFLMKLLHERATALPYSKLVVDFDGELTFSPESDVFADMTRDEYETRERLWGDKVADPVQREAIDARWGEGMSEQKMRFVIKDVNIRIKGLKADQGGMDAQDAPYWELEDEIRHLKEVRRDAMDWLKRYGPQPIVLTPKEQFRRQMQRERMVEESYRASAQFDCTFCGAKAGERCHSKGGAARLSHKQRLRTMYDHGTNA